MAHYVVLIDWTEQGIENIQSTMDRADAATGLLSSLGGELTDLKWTVGAHDLVATADAPDDETMAAFALALGSQGNVRTTTMRAFDRDEMAGVLAKLP
jgi:uncharacterized protein with GYD domain